MRHRSVNAVSGEKPDRSQSGMAAILITMITIVVISLIVIGFATVSRRELRNTTDQLQSAQAFYAAESGIDDARSAIRNFINTHGGQPVPAKDKCTVNNPGIDIYPEGQAMNVDSGFDVSYSCLKVDPSPKSLKFDGVGDDPLVIPINTQANIGSLEITWQPTTATAGTPASCPTAPSTTHLVFSPRSGTNAWKCGYGVLRTDLVPTNGGLNDDALMSGQMGAYLVPVSTAGTPGRIDFAGNTGRANIGTANCNPAAGAYTICRMLVTNIPPGMRSMMLKMSSIYRPSKVGIRAFTDANGNNVQGINGVQATIDATGKATDILRRVQVRMPLIQTSLLPDVLVSRDSICKRFNSMDSYLNIPGDIVDPDDTNQMCNPLTSGAPPAAPPCTANNDIALVEDTSGSMGDNWSGGGSRMSQLQTVSQTFINNANISLPYNHGSVIEFNDRARLDVGLTGNTAPLLQAVGGLRAGGGTQYLPALDLANQELNGSRARPAGIKVIVFISDGAPRDDITAIVNESNILKSEGIRIYTIGIGDPDRGQGNDALNTQVLTDMSGNGGFYVDARDRNALDAGLQAISMALACR